MMKIGLLGAARIAPIGIIQPAARREDVVITHLACRDQARAKDFCAANDLQNITFTDYAALAGQADVDIIYCALPPALHVDLVEAALLHGVHVLCEKPLAMNGAEAARMAAAAQKGGAVLLEAFHYFFHPALKAFELAMQNAPIGGIKSVRSVFNVPIPKTPGQLRYIPELGGGALMDLGCYNLHAIRQLFGEPRISKAAADIKHGVDVALHVQMRCGDINAEMSCDMRGSAAREDYIEIIGSEGRLRFDSFVAPHRGYKFSYSDNNYDDHHEGPSELMTYDYQLAHFIDMIGGAAPRLTAEDGVKQMRAIETIYKKVGLR